MKSDTKSGLFPVRRSSTRYGLAMLVASLLAGAALAQDQTVQQKSADGRDSKAVVLLSDTTKRADEPRWPDNPPMFLKLFENDRVAITRLAVRPGFRTDPPGKTHFEKMPEDILLVAITPGEVEVSAQGEAVSSTRVEPGTAWWIPRLPGHSVANTGNSIFEFLVVHFKEPMAHNPWDGKKSAPSSSNAVVKVTTLLENERVVVQKYIFSANSRTDPPGYTHTEREPHDVILMALTPGHYEISSVGEPEENGVFQPGKVWWWPEPPVRHSIANVGEKPFEFIKIDLR